MKSTSARRRDIDSWEQMDMRKEMSAFSSLERALTSFSYWRPALIKRVLEVSVIWYSIAEGDAESKGEEDVGIGGVDGGLDEVRAAIALATFSLALALFLVVIGDMNTLLLIGGVGGKASEYIGAPEGVGSKE